MGSSDYSDSSMSRPLTPGVDAEGVITPEKPTTKKKSSSLEGSEPEYDQIPQTSNHEECPSHSNDEAVTPACDDLDNAKTTNPKPRLSQWRETVQILVGASEDQFWVHKHALKDLPCIKQDGIWRLQDEDPIAFEEVVHFLYHRKFSYDLAELMRNDVPPPDRGGRFSKALKVGEWTLSLMMAYTMASKWQFEALQNAALDALLESFRHANLSLAGYEYVMENTVAGARLRKMVLLKLAREIRLEGWESFKEGDIYQDRVKGRVEDLESLMEAVAGFEDG